MKNLPELQDIERFEKLNLPLVKFKKLETVTYDGQEYPIKAIIIGEENNDLPVFGLFGGVHGLERIGSQVIIAFFHSLFQEIQWNKHLQDELRKIRIVSIPIVNPGGMARYSRSNPNNVDLMRNAPVTATGKLLPLASGQTISPRLPWFRGNPESMEKEAKTLIQFVQDELLSRKFSLSLDVHSGFGVKDQIWYPYAKQKGNFPLEKEALHLKNLLDQTFPHHIYKFEAQSDNYLTHGDLWDYMFEMRGDKFFLPLTLELGSWNWIRKNPLQFFSKLGLYHPVKQHRHARIMRRHIILLNFLIKASLNHESWL